MTDINSPVYGEISSDKIYDKYAIARVKSKFNNIDTDEQDNKPPIMPMLDIRFTKMEYKWSDTCVFTDIDILIADGIPPENNARKDYIDYADGEGNKKYKTSGLGLNRKIYNHATTKAVRLYRDNKPIFPKNGSILNFPFDNIDFGVTLVFDPSIRIKKFKFYNFITSHFFSKIPTLTFINDGKYRLEFKFKRNCYTQILGGAIITIAVFFSILIGWFAEIKDKISLPIAGYFISLWSIKKILGGSVEGATSFLDYFFLFITVALLLLLAVRIIGAYFKCSKPT